MVKQPSGFRTLGNKEASKFVFILCAANSNTVNLTWILFGLITESEILEDFHRYIRK